MSIFAPIIQDENAATFTKILNKSDSLVNPKDQNAVEIWNHFRAFQTFPGTKLTDDFWGEIKILDCEICLELENLQNLENAVENNLQNLETEKAKKTWKNLEKSLEFVNKSDFALDFQNGEEIKKSENIKIDLRKSENWEYKKFKAEEIESSKTETEKSENSPINSKSGMQNNYLENSEKSLENNLSKITKIITKNHWRQIKIAKKNLTFLVCQNETLLQIQAITLPNGQKIDFAGFQF